MTAPSVLTLMTVTQMLAQTLAQLTDEQRAELHDFGISRQLIHAWKTGKRLPTEPQAAIFAAVTHINRHKLQDELALLRASPAQRDRVARALGKALAGVLAMLSFGYFGAAQHAEARGTPSADRPNVYPVKHRRRTPAHRA